MFADVPAAVPILSASVAHLCYRSRDHIVASAVNAWPLPVAHITLPVSNES